MSSLLPWSWWTFVLKASEMWRNNFRMDRKQNQPRRSLTFFFTIQNSSFYQSKRDSMETRGGGVKIWVKLWRKTTDCTYPQCSGILFRPFAFLQWVCSILLADHPLTEKSGKRRILHVGPVWTYTQISIRNEHKMTWWLQLKVEHFFTLVRPVGTFSVVPCRNFCFRLCLVFWGSGFVWVLSRNHFGEEILKWTKRCEVEYFASSLRKLAFWKAATET